MTPEERKAARIAVVAFEPAYPSSDEIPGGEPLYLRRDRFMRYNPAALFAKALDALDERDAALRAAEWGGSDDYGSGPLCPVCGGMKREYDIGGHTKACLIGKILGNVDPDSE